MQARECRKIIKGLKLSLVTYYVNIGNFNKRNSKTFYISYYCEIFKFIIYSYSCMKNEKEI